MSALRFACCRWDCLVLDDSPYRRDEGYSSSCWSGPMPNSEYPKGQAWPARIAEVCLGFRAFHEIMKEAVGACLRRSTRLHHRKNRND